MSQSENLRDQTVDEEISVDLLREKLQKAVSRIGYLNRQVDDLVTGIDHALTVVNAAHRMLDEHESREVVQGALIATQMILTDVFQARPLPRDTDEIPF